MLWLYFYYIELFENGKENNDSYKESMGKNNGGEFVGGKGGREIKVILLNLLLVGVYAKIPTDDRGLYFGPLVK